MVLTATSASYRYFIVVAIGYVASVGAYPKLPGPYQLSIALMLPTTAALIYALLHVVWARDLIRDGDDTFEPTYAAILFAVGVFIVAIHLMIVAALTNVLPGQRTWFLRALIVLFGIVVVRIGNLLPRTRPNLVFGIRTSRTLANRRLWTQTHRMAGYVAVGLGVAY